LFGHQHEGKDVTRLGFQHLADRSVGTECHGVADQAARFLRNRGQGRHPFYARVGFGEVHRPYERYEPADPSSVAMPPFLTDTQGARQDVAMFHGAVRTMDQAVGTLLSALDETGLRDDTVVVFTTDHGIAFPRAKSTLYDPGLNTALLMRWSGGLAGGREADELLSNVDLMPTLLEVAGVQQPTDLTGRSFLSLLQGGRYEPNTEVFAEKNTHVDDHKRCIRTERHKYIRNYDDGPALRLPTDIEMSLTRRDMGDAHLGPRAEFELYDLEADPWEQENLAGSAARSEVERDLACRLDAFLEATNDPILEGSVPRPPGEADIILTLAARIRRHYADS
ncbi:MAG TPA: sulfatase-like hydrolase/transferase, partial [Armatimonadota bacterium]|nr:sulfatase-like hydrolase/transferase [Armatimonadota bacterium]